MNEPPGPGSFGLYGQTGTMSRSHFGPVSTGHLNYYLLTLKSHLFFKLTTVFAARYKYALLFLCIDINSIRQ